MTERLRMNHHHGLRTNTLESLRKRMLTRFTILLTALSLMLLGCTNTGGEVRPSGKPTDSPIEDDQPAEPDNK